MFRRRHKVNVHPNRAITTTVVTHTRKKNSPRATPTKKCSVWATGKLAICWSRAPPNPFDFGTACWIRPYHATSLEPYNTSNPSCETARQKPKRPGGGRDCGRFGPRAMALVLGSVSSTMCRVECPLSKANETVALYLLLYSVLL